MSGKTNITKVLPIFLWLKLKEITFGVGCITLFYLLGKWDILHISPFDFFGEPDLFDIIMTSCLYLFIFMFAACIIYGLYEFFAWNWRKATEIVEG